MANKAAKLLGRFGLDWFILSLIGMIILALAISRTGDCKGAIFPIIVSQPGYILYLFLLWVETKPEETGGWIEQLAFAPIGAGRHIHPVSRIAVVAAALARSRRYPGVMAWWVFLAALPSTVSSSVVMVSIANGNIPAAIFNASISSLMGIFITPAWMAIVTGGQNNHLDMSDVVVKLLLQILLPVVAGLLLNPTKLGQIAEKYSKQLKYFDQVVILSIVYTAFSDSFDKHMFSNLGIGELFILGACVLGLFFLVYFIVNNIARLLNFNREDRITATYCGSKKSLIHGTVMAKVIFMNSPLIGILLLPIMLYHALQLISVSIIAQGMARKHTTNPA